MELGFVETCLKGTLESKLEVAEREGLWLELAYRGNRDLSILDCYNVSVKTVQAHRLHTLHWLGPDLKMREAAYRHVVRAIRIAEEIGAGNILSVPTYGFKLVKDARDSCIRNLRGLSNETSLMILVEQLSLLRTSFLPSPFEVAALVEEVSRENVKMAVDTLHLKESGFTASEVLDKLGEGIVEVHLRDDGSNPPGKGGMEFKKVLERSKDRLLCLEYNATSKKELLNSLSFLRSLR